MQIILAFCKALRLQNYLIFIEKMKINVDNLEE